MIEYITCTYGAERWETIRHLSKLKLANIEVNKTYSDRMFPVIVKAATEVSDDMRHLSKLKLGVIEVNKKYSYKGYQM